MHCRPASEASIFPFRALLKLWASALAAAAVALLLEWRLPVASPVLRGLLILIPYGAVYLAMTHLLGVTGFLCTLARPLRTQARLSPRPGRLATPPASAGF